MPSKLHASCRSVRMLNICLSICLYMCLSLSACVCLSSSAAVVLSSIPDLTADSVQVSLQTEAYNMGKIALLRHATETRKLAHHAICSACSNPHLQYLAAHISYTLLLKQHSIIILMTTIHRYASRCWVSTRKVLT